MKSVIVEQIFNKGQTQQFSRTKGYDELSKKSIKIEEILKRNLSKEDYALLDELDELGAGMEREAIEFNYKEGFKLGLLLGLECAENSSK